MVSAKKTKPLPLSRQILLSQGACCGNGCLNCPYVDDQGKRHRKGATRIRPLRRN